MANYVEGAAILIFFAFGFTGSITTNLILYKYCYVILGYNESDCALLGTANQSSATAALEKEVQPYANVIQTVQSCIESLIAPLICFFIGSWSDKNGRKLVLLAGVLGFTLAFVINLLICIIPNVSPWFILLTSVPVVLTGGYPTFLAVLLCYISDVTSEAQRGVRMGLFEGTILIGSLAGTLPSSYAFNSGGYILVYAVSVLSGGIAFLYIMVLVSESVHLPADDSRRIRSFLFDVDLLKDTFKTVFRRRENRNRLLVGCLLILLVITFLAFTAPSSFMFMYVREKFHWSLRTYTFFSSIASVIWIAGNSLGVFVLHKLLHLPEQILMLIGFIAMVAASIILGAAQNAWLLYLAISIKFFGGFISPMSRSLISKTVQEEEVGKIFSVISALEAVTGLFAKPLYTYIYNETLSTSAGIYNYVTAGFFLLGILLTLIIIFAKRAQTDIAYSVIDEEASVIN